MAEIETNTKLNWGRKEMLQLVHKVKVKDKIIQEKGLQWGTKVSKSIMSILVNKNTEWKTFSSMKNKVQVCIMSAVSELYLP